MEIERLSFHNPKGETARRLGVLAAKVLGVRSLFEAFAGGGSRTLLYARHLSLRRHHVNEGNRRFLCELLYRYLREELPADTLTLSVEDFLTGWRRFACSGERYDWVDLDPFGSPSPYLVGALSLVRPGGFIYITSTDTATLAGRRRGDDVRLYGIPLRGWESHAELGARTLIYTVWSAANHLNMYARPLFTYYEGYAHRLLVQVEDRRRAEGIGYVHRCSGCGTYFTAERPESACPVCGEEAKAVGPLWIGPLYDRALLREMESVARNLKWKKALKSLRLIGGEVDAPMYYILSDLRLPSTPSVRSVVRRLREGGYEASRTQFHPGAVKTNAPAPEVALAALG
ncbi:MAG: hypothetical protein GXO29_02305 [Thermotogae bacterium]|nr:hypothetical protein [Thermotogota bacterium]